MENFDEQLVSSFMGMMQQAVVHEYRKQDDVGVIAIDQEELVETVNAMVGPWDNDEHESGARYVLGLMLRQVCAAHGKPGPFFIDKRTQHEEASEELWPRYLCMREGNPMWVLLGSMTRQEITEASNALRQDAARDPNEANHLMAERDLRRTLGEISS